MQANALKSMIFVLVQFGMLGALAITGPWLASNPILLGVEIAGLLLGFWAIFAMGLGNFGITPDPLKTSQLVERGPYAVIRHPMYLALLVTFLPLVIDSFSWLRLAFWLILLVDLVLKLNYEEGLLSAAVEGYSEYRERSYRLVPLVY